METLGRLAGGVAHDFNNLLTVIMGYSQFLLDGLRAEDPLRSPAEQVFDAATRASRLTSQLLAFSRRRMVQSQILDLNGIVREMIQMLRRLIGENIHLETILDPSLGRIKADAGQIEQVIVNLVVNSRDAMATGGLLRIETANVRAEASPMVMLSIVDNGCGMDHETRDQIFEPFFTTKDPAKGTGLGLATVYGIVRQSGGTIGVESEVGEGTAVRVCFPSTLETPKPATEPGGLSAPQSALERILLVEDEESVRQLVAKTLRGRGYEVIQAARGDEALRITDLEPGPIHLLITDVMLPGLQGNELAVKLRAKRPDTLVLFLSGYAPETVAFETGSSFLQKPFTIESLIRKVHEVIHSRLDDVSPGATVNSAG
jgi:CheY-like chemotaxis protein